MYCEEIIASLPPRLKLRSSFLPSLSIFCITPGGKVFCLVFTLSAFEWRSSEAVAVLQSRGPLPACLGREPASPAPPTNRLRGRGVRRQREAASHVDGGTVLDYLRQVSPCHVNAYHAWLLRYRARLVSPTNKKRF